MPNVDGTLAVRLLAMWVPLAVIWSAGLVAAFGAPAAKAVGINDRQIPTQSLLWRVAALSAFVYPLLFFSFGYFIAWQSPDVREFYLTTANGSQSLASNPAMVEQVIMYSFEVMRGLLWVGMGFRVAERREQSGVAMA